MKLGTALRWRPLRNPYSRTALKALTVRMPLRWWRAWTRLLWRTRQYPRLRRPGLIARMYRYSYSQSLIIAVDEARRLKRFGSRIEAMRSWARSHNAGLARRCIGARERIAELRRRVTEVGGT